MWVDICGYSPSLWAARTSWCHKEWGIMRQQMDTIAKGLGQVITATWRGSLVLQLSKVPSWWQLLWLFIGQYIFMNTWLIFIECSHSVWRSSWPWGCPQFSRFWTPWITFHLPPNLFSRWTYSFVHYSSSPQTHPNPEEELTRPLVTLYWLLTLALYGLPWWLSGKESTCNAGHVGFIPGLGISPGGGHGNSLQYSCLENPIDRGAWQVTVRRVIKSWTWLKWLNMNTGFICCDLYSLQWHWHEQRVLLMRSNVCAIRHPRFCSFWS